ncbi:MAG: hypothetical protein ASARMPREDX12_004068 [Alectoria sarmentosa]|nr:MAG: hypothetical protein ASARMPREDX12_004068 [Alectoria sarmentosa]
MAGRELPYDPYIPSGGSGQGGSAGYEGGNTRTAAIQSLASLERGPDVYGPHELCTLIGKNTFEGGKARNSTAPRLCERWDLHLQGPHNALAHLTFVTDAAIYRAAHSATSFICSPHPLQSTVANNTPHQQQIDDTVNVMKKNLESVAQRGEHIDQLQDKSENLNQSAQGFRRGANRVRKQMWWKNMKMRIWIIVGIIVLLLIIIIPSVVASKRHH